jgi:hypothetical protein
MKKRTNAEHLAESETLLRAVDEMDVPEPSAEMHRKFLAMLQEAKTARFLEERPPAPRRHPFLRPHFGLVPQLAAALGILVVGWFLGYQVTPRPERSRIDRLTSEVREMKTAFMLAQLQNPSAADRMKAVSSAESLSAPDKAVLDALIRTMNGDPNVNVRLVSVEALAQYADRPDVREALVQAIARQESPLVQLALADVMLALNEKRAIEPFRKVIAGPGLDYAVKSKLENAVRLLL